jgi:hypothetical protein
MWAILRADYFVPVGTGRYLMVWESWINARHVPAHKSRYKLAVRSQLLAASPLISRPTLILVARAASAPMAPCSRVICPLSQHRESGRNRLWLERIAT